MPKLKHFFKTTPFTTVMIFMQVIAAFLFYAGRTTWVFVNNTVKWEHFTLFLLLLMIANAILLAVLFALRQHEMKAGNVLLYTKKSYNVTRLISSVLAFAFFIAATIFSCGHIFGESCEVYTLYLTKSLPTALFLVFVPSLALFLPKATKKTRISICTVALVVSLITAITQLFPVVPYKFTSQPSVIDTGKNYSIVFSTNNYGTGYVEYTFGGNDYKVFDETGGRLKSDSKIHSIDIPYEHLKNNSYRVGSVRVIEQYSYGSRLGKEIISEEYNFKLPDTKNQTYLVVSDWHTMLDTAYDAISYTGEYDAVILLGDATPGVDFEEQVVSNIVGFSGEVSKGQMPVLYVRGNHETRGEYAGKIPEALGLDKFYYTADMGNYSFVVLDSGEDKDDSHHEYGGMTDYNTYRADMIEWLNNTQTTNEKVIALCHSRNISDVEPELSQKGWNELNRLGTRLMISGHEHVLHFSADGTGRENTLFASYPDIAYFIDGGKQGKDFIASKMTLSDENIKLEAFDNNGNKLLDETIKW